MVSVIFDERTSAQLDDLRQQVEVRNAEGRLLGFFTPATEADAEMYRFARNAIDPQVVAKRKNAPGDRLTSEQVRQHLESWERQACDSQ